MWPGHLEPLYLLQVPGLPPGLPSAEIRDRGFDLGSLFIQQILAERLPYASTELGAGAQSPLAGTGITHSVKNSVLRTRLLFILHSLVHTTSVPGVLLCPRPGEHASEQDTQVQPAARLP